MKKQYLDYAGLKRVLKRLLPGARKIWHGTADEWEALSETERDKYDQAEVIDAINDPKANLNPRPDWANAIEITAAQLQAGYTAPADGIFAGNVLPITAETLLTVNGVVIGFGYVDTVSKYTRQAEISCTPVSAGDIIKSSTATVSGQASHSIKFVPWKGPYAE